MAASREIPASEAKTHLARLLDEVEGGAIIDQIKAFRRRMPKLPTGEIRALIDKGRKY